MGSRFMVRLSPAALLLAGWLATAVLGCGGDGDETAPPVEQPSCAAPQLALPDGSCMRPGVAEDGCAEGFAHDGEYGCEVILPAEPCPFGLMAVPGDSECRPIMPCGQAPWGNIAVDATTVYVDAAYAAGSSDGSEGRPWTNLNAAIAASPDGATIAIAAGSYPQNVVLQKRLRLLGRCPSEVEIVATSAANVGLLVTEGASGSEIAGLALRGDALGLVVSGAENIVASHLWIHDTSRQGVIVDRQLGPSSLALSQSLLERINDGALLSVSGELAVDAVVIRDIAAASPTRGMGIIVEPLCPDDDCYAAVAPVVTVRGSRVSAAHDVGILVLGGDLTVEGTVVENTLPRASDSAGGRGIHVQPHCQDGDCPPALSATATVHASVVRNNREFGIYALGSTLEVTNTVVIDTDVQASDSLFGRGIGVETCASCTPKLPASATLRGLLVARNHETGVEIASAAASIDGIVVRDTLAPPGLLGGTGIHVQYACDDPAACRSAASIRDSLVERNVGAGIFVSGDADIERCVVRDTLPEALEQAGGRGIHAQPLCTMVDTCVEGSAAAVSIIDSLVSDNRDVGVAVLGSELSMRGSLIEGTQTRSDGLFGDGVAVAHLDSPALATLSDNELRDNARAGVGVYGASLWLGSSTITCSGIDLVTASHMGVSPSLTNAGANNCGCPAADAECQALSAQIEAPEPM